MRLIGRFLGFFGRSFYRNVVERGKVIGLFWEIEEVFRGVSWVRFWRMVRIYIFDLIGGRVEFVEFMDRNLGGRRSGEWEFLSLIGFRFWVCFFIDGFRLGVCWVFWYDVSKWCEEGWVLEIIGVFDGRIWFS